MLNYYSWWVGEKKTKLMLYSKLVGIEVEIGVELGNSLEQKYNVETVVIWNNNQDVLQECEGAILSQGFNNFELF